MNEKYQTVKSLLSAASLPDYTSLFELTSQMTNVYDNEMTRYRDPGEDTMPGSLLDFQGDSLPLIVVPDLHARPLFILNLIDYILPKDFIPDYEKYADENGNITVFQALEQKLIRIVCVGDGLHTERSTRIRWEEAYYGYSHDNVTCAAMCQEMSEGLALLCGLMKLKEYFPEHFHFLKGNHENITNRTGGGDFAFVKYVDEGKMVMEFIRAYYGDDILYLLSYIEQALPLVAVTENIVISHAEPRTAFSRYQLVNAHLYEEVVSSLTWTDNNQAEEGSVAGIIKSLAVEQADCLEKYKYIAGHRPVHGKYKLWHGGLFIQIHNPAEQNVALVYKNKIFEPENDIVSVDRKNRIKNREERDEV